METAKVDVRKLQLLNDRINQCIDALNQVRLSVHGLSHTQANAPFGAGTPGSGYFDPRFSDPRLGYGFAPTGAGLAGGLAHSSLPQIPMAGFAPGMGQISPSQIPFPIWNTPFGLSHTGLETEPVYNRPLWTDPVLAARVAQTFPYVQFALPPVVPVY